MPRLVDPDNGVTGSVGDEYAEELKARGWKSPDDGKKATARKSTSEK